MSRFCDGSFRFNTINHEFQYNVADRGRSDRMIHIDLARVGNQTSQASSAAELASKGIVTAPIASGTKASATSATARPTVGVSDSAAHARGRRASAAPSQTTQTTQSSGGSAASGSASARAAAPWSAPRMFRDADLLDPKQLAQRYAASSLPGTASGLETATATPRGTDSAGASSDEGSSAAAAYIDAAAADRAQRIADGVAAARAASAAKFPASWGGTLRSRAAAAAAVAYRHTDVLAAAGDVMGSARSGPVLGGPMGSARSTSITGPGSGSGQGNDGGGMGMRDFDAYSSSASTARALSSAPAAARGRTPSPSPVRVDTVRALNRSGAVGPAASAHLKWSQSLRGDGASSGSGTAGGGDPTMLMRDAAYADALRAAVRAGYSADELIGLPIQTLQSLVADAGAEAIARAAAVEEELLHTVGARLDLPDAVTTRWAKSLADSRSRAGSVTSGRRPGSTGGGGGSSTARSGSTRGGDARSTAGSVASLGVGPARDRELLLRTASASSLLARMRSGGEHPLLASPKGGHGSSSQTGPGRSMSGAVSVSGYSAHGLASARSLRRTGSGFGLRTGHDNHHDARSTAGGSVTGWSAWQQHDRSAASTGAGVGAARGAGRVKTPRQLRSPPASMASAASGYRSGRPGAVSGTGTMEFELDLERDSLHGSPPEVHEAQAEASAPTRASAAAEPAQAKASAAEPASTCSLADANPGSYASSSRLQPGYGHGASLQPALRQGAVASGPGLISGLLLPQRSKQPHVRHADVRAALAHMASAPDSSSGSDVSDASGTLRRGIFSAADRAELPLNSAMPEPALSATADVGELRSREAVVVSMPVDARVGDVGKSAVPLPDVARATYDSGRHSGAAVPPLAPPSATDAESAAFTQVKAARSHRARAAAAGGGGERQPGVQVAGELGGVAASALDRLRAKASGRNAGPK